MFPRKATGSFFKAPKGDRLRADKAAAAKAARVLSQLYAAVYKRDGYRCVACHASVQPGGLEELTRAHPHHIRARSLAAKAEKHTLANLCTLCPICHGDIGHTLFITGKAPALTIRRTA